MTKTLCEWSKRDIEKRSDKLLELVAEPRFFCRKCARVANTPKVLCKPRTLPSPPQRIAEPRELVVDEVV
ncbi:MAG TPA: hypothetical protein VIS96_08240 [Terrimicrobiaceae bacterium]